MAERTVRESLLMGSVDAKLLPVVGRRYRFWFNETGVQVEVQGDSSCLSGFRVKSVNWPLVRLEYTDGSPAKTINLLHAFAWEEVGHGSR